MDARPDDNHAPGGMKPATTPTGAPGEWLTPLERRAKFVFYVHQVLKVAMPAKLAHFPVGCLEHQSPTPPAIPTKFRGNRVQHWQPSPLSLTRSELPRQFAPRRLPTLPSPSVQPGGQYHPKSS